jgi:hypothetical protein
VVIDPRSAAVFIADYKRLLSEAHRLARGPALPNLLQTLASGRDAIQTTPGLLSQAVIRLEESGKPLSSEAQRAIEKLRVRQWVYLKDTSKYSIFVAQEEQEAFGVVGLTDPIRRILGGSAVTFRAGVVEYRGRYVCDGLLGSHAWLGPNYKRDFNALFKELRAEGRFHVHSEP